jgi:hypothetical protein
MAVASVQIFPFGVSVVTVVGQQVSPALIAGVPADGSAVVAVTFPNAYAIACTGVTVTIFTSTPGAYELSAQVALPLLLTGFSFVVTGGAPGSTVSVSWTAQGS